jgi:hypothetical protein
MQNKPRHTPVTPEDLFRAKLDLRNDHDAVHGLRAYVRREEHAIRELGETPATPATMVGYTARKDALMVVKGHLFAAEEAYRATLQTIALKDDGVEYHEVWSLTNDALFEKIGGLLGTEEREEPVSDSALMA